MASQQNTKNITSKKPAARPAKNALPHMPAPVARPPDVARTGTAPPLKRKPLPKQVEILRRESGAGNSGCVVAGGPECSDSEFTGTARSWQQAEGWDEEEDMGMEVEDDDPLRTAQVLAEEEVIRRRMKRVRKLMKLYREQYWALLEEMRAKYRKFYLRQGRGGWRESPEPEASLPYSGRQEPHAPDKPANATLHCAAPGPCLAKPLALSVFCLNHILLEPRQKLYKPCIYVERSSVSSTGGPCGRPVICAVSPLLCPAHIHESERQVQRAKKRSGAAPGGTAAAARDPPQGATKQGPKVHLIFAEYCKAIQRKRKALLAAERAVAKVVKVAGKRGAAETTQVAEVYAEAEAGVGREEANGAAGEGILAAIAPVVTSIQPSVKEQEVRPITANLVDVIPPSAVLIAATPG